MALEQKVPTYERVRYFNGLFLYAADFQTEADFHLATRRYLNYLLFNSGVLYLDETVEPLAVSADGTTNVRVAPGAAIVRDEAEMQAHEVHLAEAVDLDLASADVGAADGGTVYVTIGFADEAAFSSPEGGDGGSAPSEEDRRQEYAVVTAATTAPVAGDGIVTLAEVLYHSAGINSADVTDRRVRGGLRYEILSQALLDRLGTGPSMPAIAGIAPAEGVQGTSFEVQVTGANLTGATAVTFVPDTGLTVSDLTVADDAHLSFNLGIDAAAPLGSRNFRVTTPAGTARSEDFGLAFEVTAAQLPPTITGIAPAEGVQGTSFTVQVTGANLTGATAVTFVPATGLTVSDLTVADDAHLSFNLGIDAAAPLGSRNFRVITPAGTARSEDFGFAFEVVAARVLESITIAAERPAIAESGDQVQLTATGHFNVGPDEDLTGDVSWPPGDPWVATIDENGKVTSASPGVITIQASFGEILSNELQLVVGVAVIAAWPTDDARRAHGTETLTIFGERFVNPLQVSFRNPVTGGDPIVVEGEAVSLTEAQVVVPGPFSPTPADPAVVRSGRIKVTTTAGTSANSPQNFILETV